MGTVVEVLAGKAEDYMRKSTEFPFYFQELFLPDRLLVCRSFQTYILERIFWCYSTITVTEAFPHLRTSNSLSFHLKKKDQTLPELNGPEFIILPRPN